MEKVKFKFLLALFSILTTATPSFAIWKVVIDPHCLKAVTTNLATQKAIEVCIVVDSIAHKVNIQSRTRSKLLICEQQSPSFQDKGASIRTFGQSG